MKKILNILFVSCVLIIALKLLNYKNNEEIYEESYYEDNDVEMDHNIIELLDSEDE